MSLVRAVARVGQTVRRAAVLGAHAKCRLMQKSTGTLRLTQTARFSANPWAIKDDTGDFIPFPREGPGVDYSFNWSLCRDGVAPSGSAWRNESISTLEKFKHKLGSQNIPVEPVADPVSFGVFHDEVCDFLSEASDDLFVNDGAIGSYRGVRKRLRVISDNAALSAAAQSLLVKVNITDPDTPRDIVVYVATKYPEIKSNSVSYQEEDQEDGSIRPTKIVITGDISLQCLTSTIESVLEEIIIEDTNNIGAVPLPGDVLAKGNTTVLIFGATDKIRESAHEKRLLKSVNQVIWLEEGLSTFWGGFVHGDTKVSLKSDNLLSQPSSVLFVDNSNSKLSVEDAISKLRTAYKVPEAVLAKLQQNLKASPGIEIANTTESAILKSF